jgi:serine/threonine protein kinase
VVDTKTSLYLILELGNQGDLYEYIRKNGKMDEPRARMFFRQLISALSYCHKLQIAHRDLKAENIVFVNDDTLKVIPISAQIWSSVWRSGSA